MDLDFTISKYQKLCEAMQKQYTTRTIYEYLTKYQTSQAAKSDKPNLKLIVLRHDVDRKIVNALRMAELEHDLGIRSSYYFRHPYTFEPEIIAQIQSLGHEVGYHYETLSEAKGDVARAMVLFEEGLSAFRDICDVNTICMHGNVLSRYDNRDLWRTNDMGTYGILGEASLSVQNAVYFTDTGRNWNSNSNIRDTVKNSKVYHSVSTTDELIRYLESSQDQIVYINAHPERWAIHLSDWMKTLIKSRVFNIGKRIILIARS